MSGIKLMTAAGLVVTAVAFAQPPNSPPLKDEPAKESLEQLLAKALQQSPEVQIAEAKLREAEANLRQTRLQLAQKLVETYNALESQRTLLSKAEAALDRAQKLKQAQQISPQELDAAVTLVLQSKNQLVQSETALNAMTGRLPAGAGQFLRLTGVFETAAAPALADDARRFRTPRPEMAGRMRSALNKTLKVKGFDGVPLSEVVNFVREQAGDVPMLNNLQNFGDANVKVDFKGETTMGGFLQILGDVVPDLRVSVRDYGFLIGVNGLEPHDAMPLAQFWPEK